MRTRIAVSGLALLLSAVASRASAQGGVLTVGFAVGGRDKVDSLDVHSRGKLEEYRDIPTGAFLENFKVRYAPGDGFRTWTGVAREVAERDQSAWASVNTPGRWTALVRWDRIPHTFSTTARMLGTESPKGTFSLPSPRPDTASWNKAPYIAPVQTRWDPVRATLSATPTDRWDLKAEYTWINKTGERPMGMAFGSPGNNFREIGEPIDQTVQSLRLSEAYRARRWQLLASYDYSRFHNEFASVEADNPLVATSSPTNGSYRGRTALAPSNSAHTFQVTGAVSLPWRTRVTGTAVYGIRRQNQDFLPATINPAITNPALFTVPKSLNGDVRTTTLTLGASSHPLRDLTLNARVRHYRLTDKTELPEEIPFVLNDRTLTLPGEETARFPYGKDNVDASATWRFTDLASLTGGWWFERWERNAPERNTRHTNEHAGRALLTVDPNAWLEIRGSLVASRRRIVGEYLAVTEDQLPTLRRFDQANRNRTRWEVQTSVSPHDAFSVTGIFGGSRSNYPDSEFGLQLERSWLAGGEVEYSIQRVTLGASHTREVFHSRQRSKYREPTQPNNPSYDWVSQNSDYIDSFGANASITIVPKRVELGGSLELAKARLTNHAFNPTTPTGGTATQNANAAASDWPDITQKWLPATAYASLRVWSEWYVTARLEWDDFNKRDFRTDGLKPATGADIFQGNDYRDYNARFLSLIVSYRPSFLSAGRRSAL